MGNLKVCAFAAAAAFFLSLLAGVFGGVRASLALLRALGFGGLFFLLPWVIGRIVSRFLPELLEDSGAAAPGESGFPFSPGATVDIREDQEEDPPGSLETEEEPSGEFSPAPEGALEEGPEDAPEGGILPGEPEETEQNLEEGLDQAEESGYTGKEDALVEGGEDSDKAGGPAPDFLPDLDSLAGAFVSTAENGETGDDGYEPLVEEKRRILGRAKKAEGDYKPKELAQAIRTKIRQDEG